MLNILFCLDHNVYSTLSLLYLVIKHLKDRRGRMVVGFTTTSVPVQSVPIITNVVSANRTHGKVYSIQH